MQYENKAIIFTEKGKVEFLTSQEELTPKGTQVRIRNLYTAVSAGTERAALLGDTVRGGKFTFPNCMGYSDCAVVEEVGEAVTSVKPGDRVTCIWAEHRKYMLVDESRLMKANGEGVDDDEVALLFISGFSIEGVRKTRVEIGESALVTGLGILGQFAVQFLKAAGAVPVIALDFNEERRKLALSLGADYAFAPDDGVAERIKQLTDGKGVKVCIDVAGNAGATNLSLDCLARFGRISLLGCTREAGSYDLYQKVHGTGVTIVGAHTAARPQYESQPGNWTDRDDFAAILRLAELKRINVKPLINEVNAPENAPAVYERLLHDKNFPIGVLFDWRNT